MVVAEESGMVVTDRETFPFFLIIISKAGSFYYGGIDNQLCF